MAATTDQDLSRAPWRKSSYSGNGNNCVEVTAVSGLIAVRDTTDRDGITKTFDARAWQQFTTRIKQGQLLNPRARGAPQRICNLCAWAGSPREPWRL